MVGMAELNAAENLAEISKYRTRKMHEGPVNLSTKKISLMLVLR